MNFHRSCPRRVPGFSLLWLLLPILGLPASAAEATKRFDIPAGTAEKTLRQFAAQSGVEVLFSTAAATGVRTNAVKGDLAVEKAAQQMLSGTPLRVVADNKNDVLRIVRNHYPNG